MSPRKALGYSLFAVPVITLYVAISLASGLVIALKIAAISALCLLFIAVCVVAGVSLISNAKSE